MKTTVFTLLSALVIFQFSCTTNETIDHTYETIKSGFLNPALAPDLKCTGGALTVTLIPQAKQELLAMKEAGISGFDLFEMGFPKQDTMIPGGPAFLSDVSLELIKYVVIEAGKLDLSVGLNLASRLTGDAITGENYTNTNIIGTVVAKKGILPGDQTLVPWAEVPLIESGLLGPVSIKTIQVSN